MSYRTNKNETTQSTMAKKATVEPTPSAHAELFNAPLVEKHTSERVQYSEYSTSGDSSCQVSINY